MKRKIINQSLAIVFTVFSFQACSQNDKPKEAGKSDQSEVAANSTYACPMDCEKGKVYQEPGKCPVCEMDLILVESIKNNEHDHEENHADSSEEMNAH